MILINDLQLLGKGATSDVFLYNENKIIKLFKQEYNHESVKYESDIAREITKINLKVPKYYDTIQIDNRYGIIYDYIPGKLVLDILLMDSNSADLIITRLVKTQFEINQKNNSNIPDQYSRLSYLINQTDLDQNIKKIINNALKNMPVSKHVCHGDFHVGNIIYSNNEYYTIDWMNCYQGNIEGDVLRSYLMLISPYIPFKLSFFKMIQLKIYKNQLGQKYLKKYLKVLNIHSKALKKWWPIIAAARLADNVPNEKKWLYKKIERNIKYLTTYST